MFYFQDNNHKLTLIMSPSEDFDSLRKKQEEEMLSVMTSQLTDSDRKTIHEKALELVELQNKEEDLSCLPTLRVDDVDREFRKTKLDRENIGRLYTFTSSFLSSLLGLDFKSICLIL